MPTSHVLWNGISIAGAVSLLTACGSGSAGIPPCNAWIFLFGAADLTLDCPATNAVKLIERQQPSVGK